MCVLYVSFGCGAMGIVGMLILRSILLLYCAGSGVNREQVILSGFSVRVFCFGQTTTLCSYGCMYFLAALVIVCVDVMGMAST